MHYTVTVGYESEQLDREGNPRLTKSNIIVQAESNAEANITASKFLAGDFKDVSNFTPTYLKEFQ